MLRISDCVTDCVRLDMPQAASIRTLSSGTVANTDYTVLVGGNISLPTPAASNAGRLYNLLRAAPGRLAVGVDVGTALELGSSGPVARGSSTVVVLDGRYGSFGTGSNGAVSARWVLLDSYVDGDAVGP